MSDFVCSCSTKGLAILPVRYAALPSTFPKQLPEWASSSELPPLTYYKYGLRALRQGFLYVLYPENQRNKWDVYSVAVDGSLWKQADPLMAQLVDNPSCKAGAHDPIRVEFFCIDRPDTRTDLWLAFSEHKWSKDTLDYYEKNPSPRMKRINPSHWLKETSSPGCGKATEDNVNDILDYTSDVHCSSFLWDAHDIESNRKQTRGDSDQIYASEFSSGEKKGNEKASSYSYRENMLTTHTTLSPWCRNRRGNAKKTASKMSEYTDKPFYDPLGLSDNAIIVPLMDIIGISHEVNGYRNEPLGYLQQYADERAYELHAWTAINKAEILIKKRAEITTEAERVEARRELWWYPNYTKTTLWMTPGERTRSYCDIIDEWAAKGVSMAYAHELAGYAFNKNISDSEYYSLLPDLKRRADDFVYRDREGIKSDIESNVKSDWNMYVKKLDYDLYHAFSHNYKQLENYAVINAEKATVDLISIIESHVFVYTLCDYDQNCLTDGIIFSCVILEVIKGLISSDLGKKRVEDWLRDGKASDKKTVLWRALALNQEPIIDELDKLVVLLQKQSNEINDTSDIEQILINSGISWKKVADLYKKAQTLANSNAKNGVNAVNDRFLRFLTDDILLFVGDSLYKTIKGGVDSVNGYILKNFLLLRAGVSVEASLACLNIKMKFSGVEREAAIERMRAGRTELTKIEAERNKELSNKWSEAQKSADAPDPKDTNPYGKYKRSEVKDLRLSFVVGIFELWNLCSLTLEVEKQPNNEDIKLQLIASRFAMAGIVTDMGATYVKTVVGENRLRFQLPKLVGGVLSVGAALYGSIYDIRQGKANWDQDKYALSALYFLRGGMQVLTIKYTMLTSLSYVSPSAVHYFFSTLINKNASKVTLKGGINLALRSKYVARNIYLAIGIITISIIIHALVDDSLEKWFRFCAFGKLRDDKGSYKGNIEEQTKVFQDALYEIITGEKYQELKNEPECGLLGQIVAGECRYPVGLLSW